MDTGYLVPVTNQPGYIYFFGGTSASAPEWASATVMMQQAVGGPFYIAPLLYNIFNQTNDTAPFHDVLTGSNGAYLCGPGFDFVTGIGTAEFSGLASKLLGLIADVNGDGVFNMADVSVVLKEAAGIAPAQPILGSGIPSVRGDLNADGRITVTDAALMLRRLKL